MTSCFAPMPNGGPDNCAGCRFNAQLDRPTGFCSLRRLAIRNTHWRYCGDFQSTTSTEPPRETPTGPIYTSGGYVGGHGYVRIPWFGDAEPATNVATHCVVCGTEAADGIEVSVDERSFGFCHPFHYREWWALQHDDRSAPALDRLTAGTPRVAAVAALLAACNQPDRVNISTYRRRTVVPRLLHLLPDPLTASTALALTDVALRRRTLDTVLRWLQVQPMSWEEYDVMLTLERRRRQQEDMSQSYANIASDAAGRGFRSELTAPEAIERFAPRAQPCPRCGAQPRELRWIPYSTSPETWQQLTGRAGWVSLCDKCQLQIDFHIEVLN